MNTNTGTGSMKTKAEIRIASNQVNRLMRGIDNDTAAVMRLRTQLDAKVNNIVSSTSKIGSLVTGLSNAALSVEPVKATKPVKAAKSTKVAKPAKSTKVAKSAKSTKVAKPVKVAKSEPIKVTTVVDVKPAKDERPELRSVMFDTLKLSDKPLTAAAVYHTAEEIAKKDGFKVWTRQSLYNLLSKAVEGNEITKTGEGSNATFSIKKNDSDEAEKLINRVASDMETRHVV
jgi:hypothetical protein